MNRKIRKNLMIQTVTDVHTHKRVNLYNHNHQSRQSPKTAFYWSIFTGLKFRFFMIKVLRVIWYKGSKITYFDQGVVW